MRRTALAVAAILTIAFLGYRFFAYPQPRWDHSTEARIIYSAPGLMHIDFNYIPDVQVWGNGTIIWVERLPHHGRRVLQGQLSEDQLSNIVQTAIDVGMFIPLRKSRNNGTTCAYAGVDNELHVELNYAHGRQMFRLRNDAICNLAQLLVAGANLEGDLYIPSLGILYPVPLSLTDIPADAPAVEEWYPNSLAFDFIEAYQAQGQFEIEGPAVNFVWDFVNRSSSPVVNYQGDLYWIGFKIPELHPY